MCPKSLLTRVVIGENRVGVGDLLVVKKQFQVSSFEFQKQLQNLPPRIERGSTLIFRRVCGPLTPLAGKCFKCPKTRLTCVVIGENWSWGGDLLLVSPQSSVLRTPYHK